MSCGASSSPPTVPSVPTIGPTTGSEASVLPTTETAPTSGSTKLTDGSVALGAFVEEVVQCGQVAGVLLDDRRDDGRVGHVGEVIAPADPVGVEAVEDSAVGRRWIGQAPHVGGDVAVGGSGHQEAPVGEGLQGAEQNQRLASVKVAARS